jgi:hypothetical protein
MAVLDYTHRADATTSPTLGRLALSINLVSAGIFGVLIEFSGIFRYSTAIAWIVVLSFYTLFGTALGVSIAAICRRGTRTRTAWVAFSISSAIWAYFFLCCRGQI